MQFRKDLADGDPCWFGETRGTAVASLRTGFGPGLFWARPPGIGLGFARIRFGLTATSRGFNIGFYQESNCKNQSEVVTPNNVKLETP